eukprot:TRINITY_DN920_c0_g1_i1.p1 TRINITY_DN920_c0_g1~~TRINITY_DN920_c0_g1_i1.p1  ORF type:complete len:528 (-),score=136.83 TRINITY_DN920_c0_g1_i1:87-1670(-)
MKKVLKKISPRNMHSSSSSSTSSYSSSYPSSNTTPSYSSTTTTHYEENYNTSQQHVDNYQQPYVDNNANYHHHPPSSTATNVQRIQGTYGDGKHDDTSALRSALSHCSKYSEFIIPPGIYRVTDQLQISAQGVRIIGLPGSVILCSFPHPTWSGVARCDNGDSHRQYCVHVKADEVIINGLTIRNETNHIGIGGLLVDGHDFMLSHCIIDGFSQGVMMGRLHQASMDHYYHNLRISENQILNVKGMPGGSQSYGDGITFFACENVVIDGNFISAAPRCTPRNGINSGPEGIRLSNHVTLTHNHIIGDWDYPLTTEGGYICLVDNNRIENTACKSGIIERGKQVTIRDNYIDVKKRDNFDTVGICFYGVSDAHIFMNTLRGKASRAIEANPSHETGGSKNIVVAENDIYGEFFHGVYFGKSDQSKIFNNKMKSTCTDRDIQGITGWFTDNLLADGNIIEFPSGNGAKFTGCKGMVLSHNTISNTRAAVHCHRECRDVKVWGNDLRGCYESKCTSDSHVPDYVHHDNLV